MVNLLKEDHKKEFQKIKKQKNSFQQGSENNKKTERQNDQNEIDQEKRRVKTGEISRYHDPEGLTVGKLEFGYWIVRNKGIFYKLFLLILILISTVTWGLFFYTFGNYLIFGMRQDREIASDLTRVQPIPHDLILQMMPLPVVYDYPEAIKQNGLETTLITQIENPNEKHTALVDYSFYANNKELARGKDFILPKEVKYFFESSEDASFSESSLSFKINSIDWGRHKIGNFEEYQKFYQEHVNFSVNNLEFVPAKKSVLTEKLPLNTLSFEIMNNTPYNYWEVPINIILFENRKIHGAVKYVIDKFNSGEEKNIDLTISGNLERVKSVEVYPNLNVTKDDIYIEFK